MDEATNDQATQATEPAAELTPQEKVAQGVELTDADVAALEAQPAEEAEPAETTAATEPAETTAAPATTEPAQTDAPAMTTSSSATDEAKTTIGHLEDAAHSLVAAADSIRAKVFGPGGAL